MDYNIIYSKEKLDYIKKHSLKELKEVKELTELCNGNTEIIDIYIKAKERINKRR